VRIAIQQPEHLPWLGFFNKMAQVDLYVFLDNVQFKKRYFENRNRIRLHGQDHWLTVPVVTKGRYTQSIAEVEIASEQPWNKSYLKTLEHAYAQAPHGREAVETFREPLDHPPRRLVELNLALIQRVRERLGITTPTLLASSLPVAGLKGGELILEICRQVRATEYISGPDGRNYLPLESFAQAGIALGYHDYVHPTYPQPEPDFVSHLSVVDCLAQCGPRAAEIVRSFQLLSR
jgi:hypothetical protein